MADRYTTKGKAVSKKKRKREKMKGGRMEVGSFIWLWIPGEVVVVVGCMNE